MITDQYSSGLPAHVKLEIAPVSFCAMNDKKRQSIYDLTTNPFVLFNLPISASAEEISDAIEDARNVRAVPPELAISAKQVLLTPRLRTEAELECLVDCDFNAWKPILVAARSSQSMSAIIRAIEKLGPISKANVIAHCAERKGSDEATLLSWKQAVDSFDLEIIQKQISKFREQASFVKPSHDSLKAAYDALLEKHSKALLNGFMDSFSAGSALSESIDKLFKSSPKISALSILIDNYRRHTQPEFSQLSKEVRDSIKQLGQQHVQSRAIEGLSNSVTAWAHYSKPMQLFEALQGRDDAEARSIFYELRGAMLDQVDKGEVDTAQDILSLCKKYFSGPRLLEQMKADESELSSQREFPKLEPLAVMVKAIRIDLTSFAKQMERQSFGPNARSRVGDLFKEFKKAAQATANSSASDLPWLLIRNLAIDINNEANNPEAAFRLIEGLFVCANEIPISKEFAERLRGDHATADKNRKELKLIARLKEGNKPAALQIVNELLGGKAQAENENQLRELKAQLEQANYVNWGAWLWIGLVVVGIIVATYINSDSKKQNAQAPTTNYQQPNYAPNQNDLTETAPPVGQGNSLNIQQLRYCLFEDFRLDYMKGQTNTSNKVQQYNIRVGNFNARCGKFNYRRNDRNIVDRQLESQKPNLRLQSENLLNSWR